MILLLILAIAVCVVVEVLTRLDLAELERVEAETIKYRRIALERKINGDRSSRGECPPWFHRIDALIRICAA